MKKPRNRLITIVAIIFVLACGTSQQPSSNTVPTVVAATMERLSMVAPTNAPSDIPTIMQTITSTNLPSDTPTRQPTVTSISTLTRTPTITLTPTPAEIVVMDVAKLTPLPTPSPIPDTLPSGDYIYIEHVEMISCNAAAVCRDLFISNSPNYRWIFNPSDNICLLWIEDGHRKAIQEVSIEIFENNQPLHSKSVDVIGERTCRTADLPITALGDYQTKLIFGRVEFNLFWTIK